MHLPPSPRIVIVAISLSCLLLACGKSKTPTEQLTGVWLLDGSGSKTIEFKADGAVVLRARQKVDGAIAHWTVLEPGKMEMRFDKAGTELKQVVQYELKGDDELTLKDLPANAQGHYKRIASDALAKLPPAAPQPWVYQDRPGKTADVRERFATATSGEQVDGSTVDLTVRGHGPGDLAVTLDPHDEQHAFACSTGCTFTVRLDDGPATQYALAPRPAAAPFLVFFDDKAALIERLKTAKRMTIETPIGDKDTRVYEFTVAGLQW